MTLFFDITDKNESAIPANEDDWVVRVNCSECSNHALLKLSDSVKEKMAGWTYNPKPLCPDCSTDKA